MKVDLQTIWKTVTVDLPPLKVSVKAAVDRLNSQG